MAMLADDVEWVIGVDTHKKAHTVAVVDRLGGVTETLEFAADPAGYRRVLARVSDRGGLRLRLLRYQGGSLLGNRPTGARL